MPTSPPLATAASINGWRLFAHPLFLAQFTSLMTAVERLAGRDPKGFVNCREAKLLAAITKMAFEVIPNDPGNRLFWQGDTLGPAHRHWRRAKFFSGRYRLFFQFSSAQKVIVLAWVNDEETLRTYGKRSDAYAVFKAMLARNRPPSDWKALWQEAVPYVKPAGG